MDKKMQVVGGKALLSAGRGSHLLPSSCSSLFVVLSSPIRSRSRREGGQRTLQLLGTCLRPLCPGQEGWMVAQPKGFRDKEPHWWLCRHSPGWGSRRLTLGPQPCRGCEWDTWAGQIPLHPGWTPQMGRAQPLPKPQPCPAAFLQPVFN